MKKIGQYIIEKFRINKDTKAYTEEEIEMLNLLDNPESKKTLKFVLNFIRRSKSGPFSGSIFDYWYMSINKNVLSCEHSGWSHGGYGKVKYIETVIKNYNNDNGTDIKSSIAGVQADAGVPIFCIKEVVDALNKKFTGLDVEQEKRDFHKNKEITAGI